METNEEIKTIWNKKGEDLTVGDAIKVQCTIAVVTVGACVAISGAIFAVTTLAEKYQKAKETRKALKELDNL